MPEWFPVDYTRITQFLTDWPSEIVSSLLIGILAGLVSMVFGEGAKGN